MKNEEILKIAHILGAINSTQAYIVSVLLENLDEKNEININLRELSQLCHASYKTVADTIKNLKDKNILIYKQSEKIYKFIL
ncbi:replication/maintenance protein RepL [Aliarcobacter skirrowii]|uniref:replication/maintenance protein RepL n=1 Tax=Aliarcobacter skirrowii TaxID=28200 RepID=UPI000831B23F|nr:replication/maintenance protein RepL [Aliarcobacter skirrowii]